MVEDVVIRDATVKGVIVRKVRAGRGWPVEATNKIV